MKQVLKSKTYAIVLVNGAQLGVYFLCRKTEKEGEKSSTFLDLQGYKTPNWGPREKDSVIELLVKAGLTVRFFDPEESQWMDQSISYGLVRAPGTREGVWGPPLTVEDFERDYLATL